MAKDFVKIKWDGISDIKAFAKKLVADIADPEVIARRMEAALDVIEETTMRFVPIDTGATRDSFYREVEITKEGVIGRVGYNRDGALDYVGVIHENPGGVIQFIPSKAKGQTDAQDLFLSKAFYINQEKINQILKGQ